jgi:hypothetical protein
LINKIINSEYNGILPTTQNSLGSGDFYEYQICEYACDDYVDPEYVKYRELLNCD